VTLTCRTSRTVTTLPGILGVVRLMLGVAVTVALGTVVIDTEGIRRREGA
jgi:hypothetical protein